jgi:hypothetical protein
VTNSGAIAMASVGFAVSGPSASSFATGTGTCGPLLAAGRLPVQVIFAPAASEVRRQHGLVLHVGGEGVRCPERDGTVGVGPTSSTNLRSRRRTRPVKAFSTVTISTWATAANGLAVSVSGPLPHHNNCGRLLREERTAPSGYSFRLPRGSLSGADGSSTSLPTPQPWH